jgi:hypothetical protein
MSYKNKCFSVCKGKKLIKCNKNRKCVIVKGKTRKYCKLSKKYKMNFNTRKNRCLTRRRRCIYK